MLNKTLTRISVTVTFAALLTGCVLPEPSLPKLQLKCDRCEADLKDHDQLTVKLHVLARSDRKLKLLRDSSEENPFQFSWNTNVLWILPEIVSMSRTYAEYITVDQTWKRVPVRISQNCVLLSTNIPKTISLEIQYNHDGLHSNKILCEIPVVQKQP